MKFLQVLPFISEMDGGENNTDVAVYSSDKPEYCEFYYQGEPEKKSPNHTDCGSDSLFWGTSDEREPKFCTKHFFNNVVIGDGKSNYKLVYVGQPQKKCSNCLEPYEPVSHSDLRCNGCGEHSSQI